MLKLKKNIEHTPNILANRSELIFSSMDNGNIINAQNKIIKLSLFTNPGRSKTSNTPCSKMSPTATM